SAIRPWFTRLTARRNSLSARLRDEVFERRSILPGAAAGSPAGAARAATAFAAPVGAFEPDRDDGVLVLRWGMGAVNSVARRSMSTFTLSARARRVCATLGGGSAAGLESDGVGAGCRAGASRAGAGSERGDMTSAGAGALPRADW